MHCLQAAKKILNDNHRGGYTIPSARLYPFQWNWDSGFIALGYSYYNPSFAMDEIRYMFKGQWANGLLPHIVFHQPNDNYFPGPAVWGTEGIANNESGVPVSGITQPPVFGFIVDKMHAILKDKEPGWIDFLKEIFPKIVHFHRYLYEQRDPNQEGLVYIQHNWESGNDNSPRWDEVFARMDVSNARDVSALRKDIKNVDAAERPTNENYKQYIYLVDLFRSCKYDDQQIQAQCPFLIQDVLMNALLVASNNGLINIGKIIGVDVSEIEAWNEKTKKAINEKFWDEATGFYYSYDMRSEKRIMNKSVSGFLPLFAGVASAEQADKLMQHLTHSFVKNNHWLLCPSSAVDEDSFDAVKYWRGPVWINTNWMLYHGLKDYGFADLAAKVKADAIYLVENHGMYEYFDARPEAEGGLKNRGIGADLFSWTAALYIDFIHA